jgi:Mrp family chromosome partitioning ATPase
MISRKNDELFFIYFIQHLRQSQSEPITMKRSFAGTLTEQTMNSQIFVQAIPSVSGHQLTTSVHVAADESIKSLEPEPVPAIIRPSRLRKPGDLTTQIDPAADSPVPGPHIRNQKLEDYVQWLKTRVAEDGRDNKRKQQQSDRIANDTIIQPKVLPNSKQTVRLDGAHKTSPSPVTKAGKFQASPDLERIQAKLNAGLMTKADHRNEVILPPRNDDQGKPADQGPSPKLDADQIIATVSQAIAAVLTDRSEAEIEAKIRMELGSALHGEALRALPTDVATQIVQEVHLQPEINRSSDSFTAIPSDALTFDQIADPIFARPTTSAEITVSPDPVATKLMTTAEIADADRTENPTVSAVDEVVANATNERLQPQTSTEDSSLVRDIPTHVAAWDVEDFRWPRVSSQMIVTGSKAIEQLVQSAVKMMEGSSRRLAVTSSGRGEGATSIAISIARWAAAAGNRVLLVDADLVSPGLSSQVGLGPNISWLNAVNGGLNPAEVIIRSQKSDICVMPMAPITTRVSWPRNIYDRLAELTEQVISSFDLVVLDAGPVSQLPAELSEASKLVDVALLVHSDSQSPQFHAAREALQNFGITKFALAQNAAVKPQANVA